MAVGGYRPLAILKLQKNVNFIFKFKKTKLRLKIK